MLVMEHHQQPIQASHVAYEHAQSGVRPTISRRRLTPCPSLCSRFYSKMGAVEASTADTVCLTAMYTLQPLQRCRALQLYSRSTVYILYTTPPLDAWKYWKTDPVPFKLIDETERDEMGKPHCGLNRTDICDIEARTRRHIHRNRNRSK